MTRELDFDGLAQALLLRVGDLLPSWLPGGRLRGHEYVCGNLQGGPGDSLSINTRTGRWADFASNEKGGDLVSLFAAIRGIGQGEAAKELSREVNFSLGTIAPSNGAKPQAKSEEVKLSAPPFGTPIPPMEHPRFGAPTTNWCYRNGKGVVLFYVARYDPDDDRKQFVPWSWNGDRWIMKSWPAPRPLYGLELLAARPTAPVMVVEGEKAANAALEMAGSRYVVVTWPNGSASPNKADWSRLKGRKVLIWPDADEAGLKAAKRIGEILDQLCPEIKVLDVTGRADGWDAADALAEGWGWKELLAWAKPRAKLMKLVKEPELLEPPAEEEEESSEPDDSNVPASAFDAWEKLGIALTKGGLPVCNVDNALRVLENHKGLNKLIWFDDFHKRFFTKWKATAPREWRDVDTLGLTTYVQRDLGIRHMGDDTMFKAAVIHAHNSMRCEPRDWMETLVWDKTPRIDAFLVDFMGSKDTDYTRAASKNFWIAMAARIYRPGCQVDNMLVLEGPQGQRKTTALRVIGGRWYAEATESVMSKDFFLILHGRLIVEIADFDAFKKAEVTRIKQVVSCPTDRFRMPYGRTAQDHPRMSVFVGTTNEDNYLRDSTGGRRFWPVRCGEIKYAEIAKLREQLFAEAVSRFKAGEDWYKMPDSAIAEQEARRQVDEWENNIGTFLVGRTVVTLGDIAEDCLKVPIGQFNQVQQRRVGGIMRRIGWEKENRREGEHVTKIWMAPGTVMTADKQEEVPF